MRLISKYRSGTNGMDLLAQTLRSVKEDANSDRMYALQLRELDVGVQKANLEHLRDMTALTQQRYQFKQDMDMRGRELDYNIDLLKFNRESLDDKRYERLVTLYQTSARMMDNLQATYDTELERQGKLLEADRTTRAGMNAGRGAALGSIVIQDIGDDQKPAVDKHGAPIYHIGPLGLRALYTDLKEKSGDKERFMSPLDFGTKYITLYETSLDDALKRGESIESAGRSAAATATYGITAQAINTMSSKHIDPRIREAATNWFNPGSRSESEQVLNQAIGIRSGGAGAGTVGFNRSLDPDKIEAKGSNGIALVMTTIDQNGLLTEYGRVYQEGKELLRVNGEARLRSTENLEGLSNRYDLASENVRQSSALVFGNDYFNNHPMYKPDEAKPEATAGAAAATGTGTIPAATTGEVQGAAGEQTRGALAPVQAALSASGGTPVQAGTSVQYDGRSPLQIPLIGNNMSFKTGYQVGDTSGASAQYPDTTGASTADSLRSNLVKPDSISMSQPDSNQVSAQPDTMPGVVQGDTVNVAAGQQDSTATQQPDSTQQNIPTPKPIDTQRPNNFTVDFASRFPMGFDNKDILGVSGIPYEQRRSMYLHGYDADVDSSGNYYLQPKPYYDNGKRVEPQAIPFGKAFPTMRGFTTPSTTSTTREGVDSTSVPSNRFLEERWKRIANRKRALRMSASDVDTSMSSSPINQSADSAATQQADTLAAQRPDSLATQQPDTSMATQGTDTSKTQVPATPTKPLPVDADGKVLGLDQDTVKERMARAPKYQGTYDRNAKITYTTEQQVMREENKMILDSGVLDELKDAIIKAEHTDGVSWAQNTGNLAGSYLPFIFSSRQTSFGDVIKLWEEGKVNAMGAYQFIGGPVGSDKWKNGIGAALSMAPTDPNEPFDLNTQNNLFVGGLKEKAVIWRYITGKSDNLDGAMTALIGGWTSFPNKQGVSSNAEKGDKATGTISYSQLEEVLKRTRERYLSVFNPNGD